MILRSASSCSIIKGKFSFDWRIIMAILSCVRYSLSNICDSNFALTFKVSESDDK